jgi:hypothetical protein
MTKVSVEEKPAAPKLSDEQRARLRREWDELVADIQSRAQPGLSDEEIEADITEAYQEYRAEQRHR